MSTTARTLARSEMATLPPARLAYADTLKVLLVAGVIVGHVTTSWSGIHAWVLEEPPVREPLLTVIKLVALVGTMFAMALFFMIAGAFTPRSLARKGLRKFLIDRTVRLGVPVVFFVLVFAPIVEYVDSDNKGWNKGFLAFIPYIWKHPAPGPTWFLGVLLLLSAIYAVVRTVHPRPTLSPTPMRARHLVIAAATIAITSYFIRIAVPFGEEYQHLALGQAGAWVTGFVLGALGAERGWFEHMTPATARRMFRIAWSGAALLVFLVAMTAAVHGGDLDPLFGGGSWLSLLEVLVEGPLVVAMSLWIYDTFRRHVTGQRRLMRQLSRAAFAAFIVHQVIAVGAVLSTRLVPWPPEIEYPIAAALAVIGSFAVGALIIRIPGVARIV
ncbi:MAG TPA: acyltransferase [Streptosporangiaceae bacterium]|nr:acyltransferase [Streptosporangiaceae bacterium]